MPRTSLRAEHVEATRKALLKAARKQFAADGYAHVSTEQVVRAARVTRGALYHHFTDKRDLFAAVASQISDEILERVKAATLAAPTTWDGLLAGMHAFLDAFLQRDVYRIVVLDAPSVLGLEHLRSSEKDDARSFLALGLEELMTAGEIERQPPDTLAHLLLGSMMEAAMLIAVADDHEATRRDVGATLERIITGLRA